MVYDLLGQGVFRIQPSVHVAYRNHHGTVGTSLVSVSNKLYGMETHTSAELVRYSATVLRPLIEHGGSAQGMARCKPGAAGQIVGRL